MGVDISGILLAQRIVRFMCVCVDRPSYLLIANAFIVVIHFIFLFFFRHVENFFSLILPFVNENELKKKKFDSWLKSWYESFARLRLELVDV